MASVFLLGGARSGKSSAAQALAASQDAPVSIVVTAQAWDDEMTERIAIHRRERPDGWQTIEAPHQLLDAVRAIPEDRFVVLDCLTLWLSNRLLADVAETAIDAETRAVAEALDQRPGGSVVVSNEVGLGIVPNDPLGRRFRDLQGRANQTMARHLGTTALVVAGRLIPTLDPDRLLDAIGTSGGLGRSESLIPPTTTTPGVI